MKIAPGVRVRVSHKGVRTSIGPRAARLHVGTGRAGVSTGAGPAGYYTAIAGVRQAARSSQPAPRGATSFQAATPAASAKAEEARRLATAFERIAQLPRHSFSPLQRLTAPSPPAVDEAAIKRAYVAIARQGTQFWDREGRKRATAVAEVEALAEVTRLQHEYTERPRQWQSQLDDAWRALGSNDADMVLAALAAAYEDNEAPAAAVGVTGDEVSIVVSVPRADDAVPARRPTTTAAGNLSLKKLTKRETAEIYASLVSGHILATVKESFAVARGLQSARVIAVRPSGVLRRSKVEVVLGTRLRRDQLDGIPWGTTDAMDVLTECDSGLLVQLKGAARELQPLDLGDHPDLKAVVDAIQLVELAATEREGEEA